MHRWGKTARRGKHADVNLYLTLYLKKLETRTRSVHQKKKARRRRFRTPNSRAISSGKTRDIQRSPHLDPRARQEPEQPTAAAATATAGQ
jgi:hypothetical protein